MSGKRCSEEKIRIRELSDSDHRVTKVREGCSEKVAFEQRSEEIRKEGSEKAPRQVWTWLFKDYQGNQSSWSRLRRVREVGLFRDGAREEPGYINSCRP